MSHDSECKRLRRTCLCVSCQRDDGGKCCDAHDPSGEHCPLAICMEYESERKKGMNHTKTVTPLTDEQRQFAEENANLIWWFINKHRLGFNDPEKRNDWYCDLAETFLIAVQKYRPEKGLFASFVHECMWLRTKQMLTFQNRQMRSKMIAVSMNAPVKDGSNTPLEDFLQTEYCSTEDAAVNRVYASEILTQIWPVLTKEHKEAVLAKAFYEDAQRSAAASIGITPSAFRQRIRYARLRIKEKVPLELQFQQDT